MRSVPELPFINHEADGQRIVTDLCNVPDAAALSVAVFFEDAARKLRERHKVWQRQQAIRRQTKSDMAALSRLPGRTLGIMLDGHSFEEAVKVMADRQGIPIETVYHYWLSAVREIETLGKAERNKKIWQMYRSGASDQAISQTFGLSDRQIRRIIRSRLKRR